MSDEKMSVGINVVPLIENYKEIMAVDAKGQPLPCYGCPNSASGKAFPGRPSGERPCCFCVRNVNWEKDIEAIGGKDKAGWYNMSKPVKVPMDNYRSMDMSDQYRQWMDTYAKRIEELERRKGVRNIKVQ